MKGKEKMYKMEGLKGEEEKRRRWKEGQSERGRLLETRS